MLVNDLKILVGQNEQIKEALILHKNDYEKQMVPRVIADAVLKTRVHRVSNLNVANVYYKWVRRLGWIKWNFFKYKKIFKRLNNYD